MSIRSYQTGDEHAQARIYNTVAGPLPSFKPSTPEEIARRYQPADPDSTTRYYAIENGDVVGYVAFGSNCRVSYPWCLPGAESYQEPLLETMLAAMKERGLPEAWAAYRGDWIPVLNFLREHGFHDKQTMINYVAEVSRLPALDLVPSNRRVVPLKRQDLPRLVELGSDLFARSRRASGRAILLEQSFLQFPRHDLCLERQRERRDSGSIPARRQRSFRRPDQDRRRHALFSSWRLRYRARAAQACDWPFFVRLRGSGRRRLDALGSARRTRRPIGPMTHIAAQAPSDAVSLCGWYDHFFQRQGSFPILSRRLTN